MAKGSIEIDFEECKGCQLCISFCPKNVISQGTELNQKGYFPARFTPPKEGGVGGDPRSSCNGCTLCAIVCPDVAIVVKRNHPAQKGEDL
jgi:2-oxoglutarate ferredoxin oxidoreductase subunit delta